MVPFWRLLLFFDALKTETLNKEVLSNDIVSPSTSNEFFQLDLFNQNEIKNSPIVFSNKQLSPPRRIMFDEPANFGDLEPIYSTEDMDEVKHKEYLSLYGFVQRTIHDGNFANQQATILYKPCKNYACRIKGEILFGGIDIKNCAADGKLLKIGRNVQNLKFKVTNYTLTYTDNMGNIKQVGKVVANGLEEKEKLSAVVNDVSHGGLRLPFDMFHEVLRITGNDKDSQNTQIIVPCNSFFELSFTLTDKEGNTIKWSVDKRQLYWRENYMGDGKCQIDITRTLLGFRKRLLLSKDSLKDTARIDDPVENFIELGAVFHRSACVHLDFEKKIMILSRQSTVNY